MGAIYPLTLIPMSREVIDHVGTTVDTSITTWFVFPDEVEKRMERILQPYGYTSDSDELPDAEHFLGQLEYMCCDESGRYPWAIIFYSAEYPLAGHLLSIRPNREIRFSNYSICHPRWQKLEDSEAEQEPSLSIIFVFTKAALMKAAEVNSPLLLEAARLLADKAESGAWIVIADPLDPIWVQAMKQCDFGSASN